MHLHINKQLKTRVKTDNKNEESSHLSFLNLKTFPFNLVLKHYLSKQKQNYPLHNLAKKEKTQHKIYPSKLALLSKGLNWFKFRIKLRTL